MSSDTNLSIESEWGPTFVCSFSQFCFSKGKCLAKTAGIGSSWLLWPWVQEQGGTENEWMSVVIEISPVWNHIEHLHFYQMSDYVPPTKCCPHTFVARSWLFLSVALKNEILLDLMPNLVPLNWLSFRTNMFFSLWSQNILNKSSTWKRCMDYVGKQKYGKKYHILCNPSRKTRLCSRVILT